MTGSLQPFKALALAAGQTDAGSREPPAPLQLALVLEDEAATAALAARLAGCARRGDVIALAGDLGVGKTAFARAFIRASSHPHEEVPSPTFTLVQVYEPADPARPAIFHFDLYRLAAPEDAVELGLDDAVACGIALIEWPDRLGAWSCGTRLDLAFGFGPTETARTVRLAASAGWLRRLAEAGLG